MHVECVILFLHIEILVLARFGCGEDHSSTDKNNNRGSPIETPTPPVKDELSPEQKLAGDMLVFASLLLLLAAMLWLAIYWAFGQRYSTLIPLSFATISAINIGLFLKTRRLDSFCLLQFALFLFTPFALQWSIGNFVSASGISLWALLAPVAALVIVGAKSSLPWFGAFLLFTLMSGVFDFIIPPETAKLDMRMVAVFFVLNFIFISSMVYSMLWYAAREKSKLARAMARQTEALALERVRSERLLLNMLPAPIAERLKRDETNIADGHADVSVMFADIVNFTRLSEEMSPNETVRLLNDIFSEFDAMADKYGLEKIKTIGDAYMVAGGLQHESSPYVDAMADMALEMHAFVGRYMAPNGESMALRVGLATGPVVAGVIGKRKFGYDLWGDTVNVASRMSTEAPVGTTQVDSVTYRRLHNRYRFDSVKHMLIKGKGQMDVYKLLGKMSRAGMTVIGSDAEAAAG